MYAPVQRRSLARAAALALLFALVGACGKKADETATQSSPGAIAPPTTTQLQVADVTLGRSIGSDKRVADKTDDFKPNDTIYASVHTTGSAQSATVAARWTFQDGQLVDEGTESISPTGDAYTEFHISKPSGWPVGKYTLHVLVNGQEVQTKDFTVEK